MGWAPNYFSGLWIYVFLSVASYWFGPFALLLDNVPFSALVAFFLFALHQFLDFTDKITTETPHRGDHQKQTASRSQFRPSVHIGRVLFFWLLLEFCQLGGQMRSEGFITSMGDERAASSFALTSGAAKAHGVEPRQIFESKTSTNSSVKKRSYRRALQRARKHGYTWYRGKLHSAHQLGVQMESIPEKRATTNVEPPKHRQRRRLTCFSWNCSGLSPPEWDMLQIWLDSQALDVIMLQETHWSYTREWLQEKYYAIHSGAQTRQAGLLCLISKQTCRQHDISWQEVIPGRILHVRLHGVTRSVDLINLYQHVFQPCNSEYRPELWLTLSHLLSTFSKKNALILAGDANCSTDQRCSAVGYPTYARHGQRHYGSLHTDSQYLDTVAQAVQPNCSQHMESKQWSHL